MSQLTAANAAAFGNQGAQGGLAFYSIGMAKPISLNHCVYRVRGRGWPSCYIPIIGSLPSAAAESEGAAAATPSALSTPTGTTLTPAKYLISLAINSEAQHRALPENDPIKLAREFAAYGCSVYLMKDNTVGLSEVFSTVTATGGNPGARLTLDGIFGSAEDVRSNLNDANLVVSAIIDGKGQSDIRYDLQTSASSVFGNPAVQSVVKAVLADPNAQQANIDTGYWFSPDGKTPIFVESGYDMLDQVGGDRIGVCCISPTSVIQGLPGVTISSAMQQGPRQIAPAFAIAVDEDLVSASGRTANKPPEIVMTAAGPIALLERSYTGADFYTVDARGAGSVALMHDNSASQLPYLA
jgi:hypothetical protein